MIRVNAFELKKKKLGLNLTRCETNADLQTADLQTCRLADLQTRSELTGMGGGEVISPAGISPRRRNFEEEL